MEASSSYIVNQASALQQASWLHDEVPNIAQNHWLHHDFDVAGGSFLVLGL